MLPTTTADGPRKRILVVDDETYYREALCSMFSTIKADAVGVATGPEAIQQLQDGAAYDLVILDVMMPEMSGPEALVKIKAIRPEQAVLLTSGVLTVDLQRLASEMNATTLRKPFTIRELRERVHPLLS